MWATDETSKAAYAVLHVLELESHFSLDPVQVAVPQLQGYEELNAEPSTTEQAAGAQVLEDAVQYS